MATREKNIWILLLFIFAGIVVGGLLRRTCIRYRLFMVVRIWRKFWTYRTDSIRPKHYYTYIWNSNEDKYREHNWNGNSCISKQAYEMAAAMKVELLTMKAFYGYINKFR